MNHALQMPNQASPMQAVLSLGSNLGQSLDTLKTAVKQLNEHPNICVQRISEVYRTPAWGKTDQPDFYNLVVLAQTDLTPEQLLDATQIVEQNLGRVRREHWGPRTIDIDIISLGEVTVATERLQVPHPLASQRAFVIIPWRDIDPQAMPEAQVDAEGLTKLGPL